MKLSKFGWFFGLLVSLLGAILLGNLLTGKGVIAAEEGTIRAGEGTIRAGQDFKCRHIL